MCTYQENLGEDGYFDLLQESNPTSMKSVADVMDPMFVTEGTVEF